MTIMLFPGCFTSFLDPRPGGVRNQVVYSVCTALTAGAAGNLESGPFLTDINSPTISLISFGDISTSTTGADTVARHHRRAKNLEGRECEFANDISKNYLMYFENKSRLNYGSSGNTEFAICFLPCRTQPIQTRQTTITIAKNWRI